MPTPYREGAPSSSASGYTLCVIVDRSPRSPTDRDLEHRFSTPCRDGCILDERLNPKVLQGRPRDSHHRTGYHAGMADDSGRLDEVVRLLSHQLKSPLDAVRSLLDGIAHVFGGDLGPEAARLLERAALRAEEARELVNDLLEYQSFGSDQPLPREPLDILPVAAGAAAALSAHAADKGVSLVTALPDDLEAWVRGSRRALEQVLHNLVENAVKYTPADGRVTVRSAPVPGAPAVEIEVEDTGVGIEDGDLPRLFEPFFRSARHRGTVPGTGLGLSLARRIAEAHGGSLAVQSAPGRGSTFTLSLPADRVVPRAGPSRARRRVVIVGGVTAGPKAAARLRRLDPDAQVTMIEQSEFLSYTGCGLPDYVSGRVDSPRELMSTADETLRSVRFFQDIKDVRVLSRTLVEGIDRAAREVRCRDLATGRTFAVPYDALVLATGTRMKVPPVPGVDLPGVYSLYGLEGARDLRARLRARGSHDVHVIGAGYIGVSLADPLVTAGARVTLLEREEEILARYLDADMAVRIRRVLERRGVKVVCGSRIAGIRADGERLAIDTDTGTEHSDAVVLATGAQPRSELARDAGLALGPSGGIRVDGSLRTSDERIWAVGDCAETANLVSGQSEFLPLGSVSTRMGRVAADAIAGRAVSFRGSLGTSMFRIFGVNVARSGLTEERAGERGFAACAALVVGLDRPHYEPGAARIVLKVIADRSTGRLLGVQGLGPGQVVGRVQVLATAMSAGATLEDVTGADLGFNPAFTTPIDLAQTACMVLQAKIEGLLRTIRRDQVADGRHAIVDVSPYSAFSRLSLPGSVNVPLESLRREGIPYDRDREIVLCDATSAGAWEAFRILQSRGWEKLWVLEGGLEEAAG